MYVLFARSVEAVRFTQVHSAILGFRQQGASVLVIMSVVFFSSSGFLLYPDLA